jgi:hypothetical protein
MNSCPSCHTKKVSPVGAGVFICSRRHIFSVYTEDEVVEIEDSKKINGPDLIDGKDSHGHGQMVSYYSPIEIDKLAPGNY